MVRMQFIYIKKMGKKLSVSNLLGIKYLSEKDINLIFETSDNLKDFPQWQDANLNEESIDTICASSEIEYSALWSKPVRFKKCIIHPKIKNSIFLEMDGIVANTQVSQLLLFENGKMYIFSLTCSNKCKQWKKVFSICFFDFYVCFNWKYGGHASL